MHASSPARRHLALPYAVLGAAGSWMAADFFRVGALHHMDAGLRPALMTITPLAALILGLLLHPVIRWSGWRAALATASGVLSAGLVAGAFVGVMTWSKYGLGEGAASGFWCGAAFLPGFAAVLWAARRVGRARPGSLVDGADRRAVWVAVAAAVALGTLAALPDWTILPGMSRPSLSISRALGAAAAASIAALLLCDGVGLVRAWRARRELKQMRPCAPDEPGLSWARRQLDLGLGYEAAASVMPAAGIYREHDRVLQVIRGDAGAASRALLGSVGLGVAALACAVGCLLATANIRTDRVAEAPPAAAAVAEGVAAR